MEYTEDDGEYGGSRRILQEMQTANVMNRVIVVSRWYSGVKLGPKRFTIIAQCTKAAINKTYNVSTPAMTTSMTTTPPAMMNTMMTTPQIMTTMSSSSIQPRMLAPETGAIQKQNTGYMFTSPTPVQQIPTTFHPSDAMMVNMQY